jgi:hypothetical protein
VSQGAAPQTSGLPSIVADLARFMPVRSQSFDKIGQRIICHDLSISRRKAETLTIAFLSGDWGGFLNVHALIAFMLALIGYTEHTRSDVPILDAAERAMKALTDDAWKRAARALTNDCKLRDPEQLVPCSATSSLTSRMAQMACHFEWGKLSGQVDLLRPDRISCHSRPDRFSSC